MARDNRYLTAIITNGLLLDKHIDELVEAGLCDVQLSVYSNTIEKLKPILPIVAPRVPINISFVLTKSYLDSIANINFRPLIDLILLCRDCSSFKFNICQPQHGSNDFSETICTGDANYERFVDLCKRELKNVVFEGYKARRFHLSFNHFSVFMPDPLDLTSDKRGCKQPWSFCVLDGVGNAYICCGCCTDKQVFEASDPNIDVFDRCEGALNSPKAQKVRSSLRDKNAPLQPECVDCAFRVGGYSSNI
ncbi:hypothetical protein AGMMS50229_01070 [Campylobacterota bacterium]|nr:hypothetical protein AGMMS50229_01070 [Campylobacterota bacterium]